MQCLYANVDQLLNKRDELCMFISDNPPDVMLFTECIPKAQRLPIAPALLAVPGYHLFTNFDLNATNLGSSGIRGICVYVRDCLQATEIAYTDALSIEQLWIKIKLRGSDSLVAGCLYRSPSGDTSRSMDEIDHLFHTVHADNPSHLLICGDLNVPQIDWTSHFSPAPESHVAHKLLASIQDCLLYQHVTQPTRYREGNNPSTLDLVLTNEEGMVSSLSFHPGLGKSDHVTLIFHMTCYTTLTSPGDVRRNFHKADYPKLCAQIGAVDWLQLEGLDIEEGYQLLRESLANAVSECIPLARSSRTRKNIYMTSQALRLKKQKLLLWRRYTRSQDPLDLARFKTCRNKLRGLTRRLRQQFETQLVNDIKVNPKAFW